ncbi:hypothetical protein LBMAG49_14680 [Planctomycetota bacterium]|nr:hypothetical protein LBMAG49_14680 [Planctomycetota bacterium]
MLRTIFSLLVLALLPTFAAAQDAQVTKFVTELNQGIQLKDDKLVDKALKQHPQQALQYFQDLRLAIFAGRGKDMQPTLDVLKVSWLRAFEQAKTLEKVEGWIESQDQKSYESFAKYRGNVLKAWAQFEEAQKLGGRKAIEDARDTFMTVARQMETTGHKIEAAEAWNYVAVCLSKIPDKTMQDRRDAVLALEQFVAFRQSWDWTKDSFFAQNQNFMKSEKARIELDEKAGDKRKAEGYGDSAKGIETLVMPKSVETTCDLVFESMAAFDAELDYSQKGGPLPAFWWNLSFEKEAKSKQMTWFRRMELHLARSGANKFAVTTNPAEVKLSQEVEVGGKAKPTTFYLDAEKKVPYAMYFWTGSDKEHIGEAEVNLSPSDSNTPVYYRSAASFKTTVAGEPMVFYDDNTNGRPMDSDPMDGKFPMHTLGVATREAPLLDSMRIGKGPRVPFSEFVYVGGAWRFVHRISELKLGTRPLNPEYFKTGKVKFTWAGPKPTTPVQLVIRGMGDFAAACFDVASGKEVELPAGDWQVLWGRILQGKGSRAQMGTIYGADNKPFTVEAGKTFELKMGAPFSLAFERGGADTDPEVKIDSTRIGLRESSGCMISELQGMSLVLEVLAAKEKDGKGSKVIGKFMKFTDSELLNAISRNKAYADLGLMLACFPVPEGSKDTMELKLKVPAGFKVALAMKKHPLFGDLKSAYQ